MNTRRRFLKVGAVGGLAAMGGWALSRCTRRSPDTAPLVAGPGGPIVISTWDHGRMANAKAFEVLQGGGSILDAVQEGVAVVESDLTNRSVGLGGWPDRDGITTLDACIQDHGGRAGAVAFVRDIENPIRVARAVMERTPHVMLVGSGAERWALENGFSKRVVEIPEVRQAWQEWLKVGEYKPVVNVENHDTIGLVALDAAGQMAGSCTTSGLRYKVHGRVGDSPIIGAGLFVDGDVGAACATGTGELVIRTAGSHTVVELMRQGVGPEEACRQAVERILRKHPGLTGHQVGFLALRKDGAHGAFAIYKGFTYAIRTAQRDEVVDAPFVKEWE